MLRCIAIGLALLSLSSSADAVEPEFRAAQDFIDGMIVRIEAQEKPCARTVGAATRSREMGVVCAKFGGSFEKFESRWRFQIVQQTKVSSRANSIVEAQTGWQQIDGIHERIYAVDRVVIGVRFTQGDLVIVYK